MCPRPRFENLDDDKRGQILDAAAEEFGNRGFAAASFNKIIARAKISKGAAYYYFDDKADLFATVIKDTLVRLENSLGPIDIEKLEAETFWEDLEEASTRSMLFLARNPWAFRLMKSFLHYVESHPNDAVVRALWAQGRERVATFLRRGQELDVIRDDIPLDLLSAIAFSVGETIDRWMFTRLEEIEEDEIPEVTAMVLDIYRRMLAPSEAQP